jgi:hypothetical protein
VNPHSRIVLFALLFAPPLTLAQSFTQSLNVHAPFDPTIYVPLDGSQRWQRWVNEDGRTASLHVESLGTAAYLQTFNVPSAWTRSGGGFARRLGSSYGSNIIQNSMHESLAAIKGTDPRYFSCNCDGLFRRGGHAFKMSFLTYNRSGYERPDLPQIASIYGSSMIEAMWYPHHYTALVQGVQSGHIEVGFIVAEHLVQEFSPELKHMLHLHFGTASSSR